MNENTFLLGNAEDHKLIRLLRAAFGIICTAMAAIWAWYGLKTEIGGSSIWLAVLFLAGFGLYLIWVSAGKAVRYITINTNEIVLKKGSLTSPLRMNASEISSIDIFPLSIVFFLKERNKILLRLGAVHYESNERIIDRLVSFAVENNISYEVKEEV